MNLRLRTACGTFADRWQRPCYTLNFVAHVVAVFDASLALTNGRVYVAQACGRRRDDGRWEGWLEFVPTDASMVLRTERETTQRNLADLEHWAGTLTPVYLQGALERTVIPPPVVVEPPEVPSVYDEPAPRRSVVTPIRVAQADAVLDPFAEFAADEEGFVRRLTTLRREELRAIIIEYDLADASVDLDALTMPELVGWIVGAVRWRLAS
jgi:hypothetical protein